MISDHKKSAFDRLSPFSRTFLRFSQVGSRFCLKSEASSCLKTWNSALNLQKSASKSHKLTIPPPQTHLSSSISTKINPTLSNSSTNSINFIFCLNKKPPLILNLLRIELYFSFNNLSAHKTPKIL